MNKLIRSDQDSYSTPPWCYEALEPFIYWEKICMFLEPCAGDGRILRWAEEKIKFKTNFIQQTLGLDIRDKFSTNYITRDPVKVKDSLIITNPPYSLAMEFVKKGIEESICSFWLLRLGFLASQHRAEFFKTNPLSALIILSKRPSFRLTGGTDNSDYAWFVWDKEDICKVRGIVHI